MLVLCCLSHCSHYQRFCVDNAGEDVQVLVDAIEEEDDHSTHTDEHAPEEPAGSGEHCHFHAGVE